MSLKKTEQKNKLKMKSKSNFTDFQLTKSWKWI